MTGEEVVPLPTPAPPAVISAPDAETEPVVPIDAEVAAMATLKRFKVFADVPLHLTFEIGRLQMLLKEILGLKPGDVFRVAKAAGEPFDICANGQTVARGEVIVVENSSGVRVTEVVKL